MRPPRVFNNRGILKSVGSDHGWNIRIMCHTSFCWHYIGCNGISVDIDTNYDDNICDDDDDDDDVRKWGVAERTAGGVRRSILTGSATGSTTIILLLPVCILHTGSTTTIPVSNVYTVYWVNQYILVCYVYFCQWVNNTSLYVYKLYAV